MPSWPSASRVVLSAARHGLARLREGEGDEILACLLLKETAQGPRGVNAKSDGLADDVR